MPTITTGDLEVVFPKSEKKRIEVAELKAGTEIIALKKVSGLETTVTGKAAFVGKGVSESSINLKSTKKNTPKVVLQTTNFTKSDIKISGKGAGVVKSNTGSFTQSKITGGKGKDSVSFSNKSTVNKGKIDLGKGHDSITFAKRTTFKGKTKIDLGEDGRDVVTFGKAVKKGSVVINNFDKKDNLVVGKDNFDYKDIKKGAEIPGIKIKLA